MRFGNPSKKTKVVSTLVGHSIEFPGRVAVDAKGTPTDKGFKLPDGAALKDGVIYVHVPDIAVPEVIAANMEAEDAIPEKDEPAHPQRPADPAAMQSVVFDAFESIVKEGSRESFSAAGAPTPAAVSKVLGWTISNTEVKDLWLKYQAVDKD